MLALAPPGESRSSYAVQIVTEDQFEKVLTTFIGEIEQTPPPYSAVKVQGRKAYEMARQGEEVQHHHDPAGDAAAPEQPPVVRPASRWQQAAPVRAFPQQA